MAEWDTDDPGDSDVVSQFPANERAARAAAKTNFGVDHHDTDDSDVGTHEQVTLIDRAKSPTGASGRGFLFTKNTDGRSEAFWVDSNGDEYQLTSKGFLRSEVLADLGTTPTPVTDKGRLYTKTHEGQKELFWLDDQGNEVRLTFQGELAMDLQNTDVIVGSIRTLSFSRGNVVTITPETGAAPSGRDLVQIDWEAGTVFRVTLVADSDLEFINMPDTSVNEEQTIYVDMQDGGNFFIGLISDFTLLWPAGRAGTEELTTDGRDLFLATTDDGTSVMVVPMLDMSTSS